MNIFVSKTSEVNAKGKKIYRKLINPLNTELNPNCHLLALLGAHHILDVGRIRVKFLHYCHLQLLHEEE